MHKYIIVYLNKKILVKLENKLDLINKLQEKIGENYSKEELHIEATDPDIGYQYDVDDLEDLPENGVINITRKNDINIYHETR